MPRVYLAMLYMLSPSTARSSRTMIYLYKLDKSFVFTLKGGTLTYLCTYKTSKAMADEDDRAVFLIRLSEMRAGLEKHILTVSDWARCASSLEQRSAA
jgi:hypothetical protein